MSVKVAELGRLASVLAMLPELSAGELAVVISSASQLKIERSTRLTKAASKRPAKAKKGPAKLVSEYSGIPEYQQLKAAEKELRSFLKLEGLTLKQAQVVKSDHPVITAHQAALGGWLETKALLSSPSAKAPSSEIISEEKKESG
jgi:hypothetical protein